MNLRPDIADQPEPDDDRPADRAQRPACTRRDHTISIIERALQSWGQLTRLLALALVLIVLLAFAIAVLKVNLTVGPVRITAQ